MKTFNAINLKGAFGRAVKMALLVLSLGVAAPLAHATSGNATIYNESTVSYTSGTSTLTATADVSVTVITLAANPTVTVDSTAQTVAAGANAVYNYTLRSNANGIDTYNLTMASVDANVSASTDGGFPTTSTLWGGNVIDSPAANTVRVPGGSVGGDLTAGVSTVEVFDDNLSVMARFTVTTITPGNAESSGTPEVLDTLVLTPIVPSVAFGAGDILAGTQIGEFAVTTLTQTAGTPTIPGTDGTHTNNLTSVTTATDLGGSTLNYTTSAGDSNETITTVSSPAVTILKESRNFSTLSAFVSDGSTVAKPGEVIEYRITVTNTHATASTTNVYLTDALPDLDYTTIRTGDYGGSDVNIIYTDLVGANDYDINQTIANDGDQAEVSGSTLTATVGFGAGDAGVPTGGVLDAGDSAQVLFRVDVD